MIGLLALIIVAYFLYVMGRAYRLNKHMNNISLDKDFFQEWWDKIECFRKLDAAHADDSTFEQSVHQLNEYEKKARENLDRITGINYLKVIFDPRIKIEEL